MSKPIWACPICAEDFTRKSSALRHIKNLHEGRCPLVRYIDYIVGRQSGFYPPPLTPPRLLRNRTKMKFNHSNNHLTVADSSKMDFSLTKGMGFNNGSQSIADRSFARATNMVDPIAETTNLVLEYVERLSAYNRVNQPYNPLLPSMNFNSLPTDISVAKPLGLRAYVCNLCLSGATEAVFNFVKDGCLAKVNHICDAEVVMRAKHLPEDKRKASHEGSFRLLAELVKYWIGQNEVYLKAEGLSPMEFGTAERPASHGDYIDLGDLKENHWANRAIKENKKTTTAAGAVTIDESEIRDFLRIAMATFAVFQIRNHDGSTRDYFIYMVNGLGSCKDNPLKKLATRCINNNNCDRTSQQTDWNNVIQFVNAGPSGNSGGVIFRWDKIDSGYQKN
jgi:hypothetical protein